MKKILTLLTGIAILITILAAVGCTTVQVPQATDDLSVVIIYMKDTLIGESHHLLLWDSNNPENKVVDKLITDVEDSSQVFWTLADNSGIRSLKKIKPKEEGKILTKTIKGGILVPSVVLKYKVPPNQAPEDIQAYKIKVKDIKGERWEIDPHLKIPPEN